jgi:prophage regulatory protein
MARIIRIKNLPDKVGLSKSSIMRMVKEGTFPQPIQISEGAIGWLEAEVDDWIAEIPGKTQRLPVPNYL